MFKSTQIVLLAFTVSLCVSSAEGRKRYIAGGEQYITPRRTFSIVVPKGDSPIQWHTQYEIIEPSDKRQKGEVVIFWKNDLGQYYKAVVEEAGERDLGSMADLNAITSKALVENPPKLLQEEKVDTHLGEGVLRVYFAESGAFLKILSFEGGKRTESRNAAYVAVLAVIRGGRFICAVVQDDYFGLGGKKSEEELRVNAKRRVEGFFSTIKLEQ